MDTVKALEFLAKNYGLPTALLIILAAGLIYFLYKSIRAVLNKLEKQYQNQIDRLAADNREYRAIFLTKVMGLSPEELRKIQPPYLEEKENKKGEIKKINGPNGE